MQPHAGLNSKSGQKFLETGVPPVSFHDCFFKVDKNSRRKRYMSVHQDRKDYYLFT